MIRKVLILLSFIACSHNLFAQNIEELKEKASKGDIEAMFDIGEAYFKGTGVPQDDNEAFRWYLQAAEKGDPDAQYAVGYCYELGRGVAYMDSYRARRWYLKAAEQGHAEAQGFAAYLCWIGAVVPEDKAKVFSWALEAAERGVYNVDQFMLADFYRDGYGVPKDDGKAFYWFLKVAKQGDEDAQNIVGECYSQGKGVKRSNKKAVKWFRQAMKEDNAWAFKNMATCI